MKALCYYCNTSNVECKITKEGHTRCNPCKEKEINEAKTEAKTS